MIPPPSRKDDRENRAAFVTTAYNPVSLIGWEVYIQTMPFPAPVASGDLAATSGYALTVVPVSDPRLISPLIEVNGHPALHCVRRHAAYLLQERLLAVASFFLLPLEQVELSDDGPAQLRYAPVPRMPRNRSVLELQTNPAPVWRAEQALALVRTIRAAHATRLVHGHLDLNHLIYADSFRELRLIGLGAEMLRLPESGQPAATASQDLRALPRLLSQLLSWTADGSDRAGFPVGVQQALNRLTVAAFGQGPCAPALDTLESTLESMTVPELQVFGLDLPGWKCSQAQLNRFEVHAELTGRLLGRRLPGTPGKPWRYEVFTSTFRLYLLPSSHEDRVGDLFVAGIERCAPDGRDVGKLTPLFVRYDEKASSRPLRQVLDQATAPERLETLVDGWRGARIGQFILERDRETIENTLHLRARYECTDDRDLEHVTLRFTRVSAWNDDAARPLEASWRAAFRNPEDVTLRRNGRTLGRGTAWDNGDLRVTLLGDTDLSARGELELIDQGRQTLFERASRAMADLRAGRAANPRLPWILVDPSRARVEDAPPVTHLVQDLQPEGEVRALIGRMLGAPDLFTVQGPPGAGKTTLITELMLQELARRPRARILVASQARAAVSNVFERLNDLRIQGNLPGDVLLYQDDRTRPTSPEFVAWASGVQARSEEVGHPALETWRRHIGTRAVEDEYLRATSIYGATLMRLPRLLRRLTDLDAFDLVIIDEAARATLPELLVAMLRGKRVILVGDHRQLPPHLEDLRRDDLRDAGFTEAEVKRSLFEELFAGVPEVGRAALPSPLTHSLDTQYRMVPSISRIVSEAFYQGALKTGQLGDRTLAAPGLGGPDRAFWYDLAGQPVRSGTSWRNPEQTQAICTTLQRLDDALAAGSPTAHLSVAVICAYRAHAAEVARKIRGLHLRHLQAEVKGVDTVDAFQGHERDVILYASGRPLTASPFVADPQRLNVAFSRARRLLIVVGDRQGSLNRGPLSAVQALFRPLPTTYSQEARRGASTENRDHRQSQRPRPVLALDRPAGSQPEPAIDASGDGRAQRRRRRRSGRRGGTGGPRD